MLAFKTFRKDLTGLYQSGFKYPPIGQWTQKETPEICYSGYHVANSFSDITSFIESDEFRIFIVECRGKRHVGGNKTSFEQIRLLKEVNIKNDALQEIAKILNIKFQKYDTKYDKMIEIYFRISLSENKTKLNKVAKILNIPRRMLTADVSKLCAGISKAASTKARQ